MPAPTKRGLSYFNLDVDFFSDIKIRKMIKYQGGKAVTVYAYLLCFIYKNGYYILWDHELPFIISESTGFDEAYIQEVVNSCLNIGLFSKNLYEKDKILTSKSIQDRYNLICRQAKRSVVVSEFSLVNSEETGVNSEETGVNSEEIPINSGFIPQRKEKKSKEKESTKEKSETESPEGVSKKFGSGVSAAPTSQKKSLDQRKESFVTALRGYEPAHGREMLNEFYRYWVETNKSGSKMRWELEKTWDLNLRLLKWAANRERFRGKTAKIAEYQIERTHTLKKA